MCNDKSKVLATCLLIISSLIFFLIIADVSKDYTLNEKNNNLRECKLSYGHYSGKLWSKETDTKDRTCLLESNRMRVDHHERKIINGKIIHDWLWIEYGDRVNVLVREKAKDIINATNGSFVVFQQTKYAIDGESLAVVGGFIEHLESAEEAALREVREELNLSCDNSKLISLGKYRADANRGLGFVNAFLAIDCEKIESNSIINISSILDSDTKQDIQIEKRMSLLELESEAKRGNFREVQWSNTVSLALLHLKE